MRCRPTAPAGRARVSLSPLSAPINPCVRAHRLIAEEGDPGVIRADPHLGLAVPEAAREDVVVGLQPLAVQHEPHVAGLARRVPLVSVG